MYIRRIILKDARTFTDREFTLWNDWLDEPLSKVLFTGPNGSGKTTLVRVITDLWASLEDWLRLQKASTPKKSLQGIGLAAIELYHFPDVLNTGENAPIWIYVANDRQHLEAFQQGIDYTQNPMLIGEERLGRGRPALKIPHDFQAGLNQLREELQASRKASPIPNIVALEAENRLLIPPSKGRADTYPEAIFKWLVTYEPSDRWEGHLESMLKNLKVVEPEMYRGTIQNINQFLKGKQIDKFDDSARLVVKIDKKRSHYLDDLSAGERQCLIMMFMVSRWLQRGGIVLIDEPDLHLHVSLQRHFINELYKIVNDRQGQLIITSHSPELWEEFNYKESFDLGGQQ